MNSYCSSSKLNPYEFVGDPRGAPQSMATFWLGFAVSHEYLAIACGAWGRLRLEEASQGNREAG